MAEASTHRKPVGTVYPAADHACLLLPPAYDAGAARKLERATVDGFANSSTPSIVISDSMQPASSPIGEFRGDSSSLAPNGAERGESGGLSAACGLWGPYFGPLP